MTDFAGRYVKDADPDIIEALRESGRLLRAEVYEHAYPHCWRCDTPLLYYATSSWYLRTTEVRDRMLDENEAIGWHPEHIKHGRFGKWLENNVDWALSRERYWGTPLPIWRCQSATCGELFCAGSIADLRERGGEVPEDLHRPYIDEVVLRCEACEGEMRRVEEVIDAWYDSGSMPFAQFHHPFEGQEHFEDRFPAAFISEAIDQTRGWFYSLLAVSTLIFDRSSYRNCVCLGLILDPRGPEDVDEPRKRRRSVGGDLESRRGRFPLVLHRRPAAVGRLPLLVRHRRGVGAPVHAHALEHLLVLGAVRERGGTRTRGARRVGRPPTTDHRGRRRGAGSVGAVAPSGRRAQR